MRRVRAGYAGGITWMDSQLGRVLGALDALPRDVRDNTVVLFFSDHGWGLGEHGFWCKMANTELQTRVPLLVRVPWLETTMQGARTSALVELVDIFATLADLTGIDVTDALEGTSFVPILKDPTLHTTTPAAWKNASFSQYVGLDLPVFLSGDMSHV